MKKLITIAISLLMIASMTLGCGSKAPTKPQGNEMEKNENFNKTGLPIVKTPETYTIMTIKSPSSKKTISERQIMKDLEKETNVKVEWREVPKSGWNEKINITLQSGQLPDAVYATGLQYSEAIKANQLVCVDDYLDIAPNLKKIFETCPNCEVMARYTEDGKHYTYPGAETGVQSSVGCPTFINKTWLDKLGLKMPTTTDELYEVLKAFKTGDPNGNGKADEVPFGLSTYWGGNQIEFMFGSWDMETAQKPALYTTVTIRDGKVDFNPVNPKYKDALNYFAKLYKDGLTDPEYMTMDSNTRQTRCRMDPPIYGVICDIRLDFVTTTKTKSQYVPMLPLKGPHGDQFYTANNVGSAVHHGLTIFTSCKHPEVLMRWMDYQNEGLNVYKYFYGEQGISWDIDKATNTYITKDDEIRAKYNTTVPEYKATEAFENNPTCDDARFTGIKRQIKPGSSDEERQKIGKMYEPYVDFSRSWIKNLPISPSTPESRDIALLLTDLSAYINAFMSEGATNGITDEQWKAHLKKCEDFEYKKIVAFWQKQYDSVKNK